MDKEGTGNNKRRVLIDGVAQNEGMARARNHTVLLTPNVIDQVRHDMKGNDDADGTEVRDAIPQERKRTPTFANTVARAASAIPTPPSGDDGFETPAGVAPVREARGTQEVQAHEYVEQTHSRSQESHDREALSSKPVATPVTNDAVRYDSRSSAHEGLPSALQEPHEYVARTVTKQQEAPVPALRETAPAVPPVTMKGAIGELRYVGKVMPLVGFLVNYAKDPNGEFFVLRAGRVIITSEEVGTGSVLVLHDDSVSPMHAIVRIGAHGDLQVLDQLSERGTVVKKTTGERIELSGDKAIVEHGDMLCFGDVEFFVSLVKRSG